VACQREDPAAVAEEAADLIYHALVACAAAGVDAGAVLAELDGRLNR
jgi:phosphoribosyl-ATP pyrophosphohydrolase